MRELTDTLSKDKWKRFGVERRAGVLVPLFSVYSQNSIGIGDFGDLKPLIDWCAETGNSILQLLPMNEVGSTFCPYDAISSFALEPAYISLASMPSSHNKTVRSGIDKMRKKFPAGKEYVDYTVKKVKNSFLREVYPVRNVAISNGVYLEEGPCGAKEFLKFVKDNKHWLDDFALFKVLKSCNDGKPWYEWADEYRNRDSAALSKFKKEYAEEVDFQKWVQWIAYSQFKEAKSYAASKAVAICGDLPILISRDSVDVWANPEYFKLKYAAGAPPDMYCAKGQRWGMPTYDWDRIARDDFDYVRAKLKFAESFYDILRIDHVVGLFRIWSIPENEGLEDEGLDGSFDPRDENTWEEHGRRILSVMNKSTGMLLLAEDLGMIPKSCPKTLEEFGIPGNDVQRWTKDWTDKHDFLGPKEYRLNSVSMLSTHDTTNWAAWWQYEAGTIDEALFVRKCGERGIDYGAIKGRLFDDARSKHGRFRWLDGIESVDMYVSILGKRKEELKDFIELYENTYSEKEKLWKRLRIKGPMREKPDGEIVKAVFDVVLASRSVFCINLITDYLYFDDILPGDPYRYRINRPGTVSKTNWSLVMPLSLEKLAKHKVSKTIKRSIVRARF
jgi:4-alpha-glucanotransferase